MENKRNKFINLFKKFLITYDKELFTIFAMSKNAPFECIAYHLSAYQNDGKVKPFDIFASYVNFYNNHISPSYWWIANREWNTLCVTVPTDQPTHYNAYQVNPSDYSGVYKMVFDELNQEFRSSPPWDENEYSWKVTTTSTTNTPSFPW